MSRRQAKELLPDIKPASQYQEKLKKMREIQEENVINEQIPLITRAFAKLEQDITEPVSIQLKQPLNRIIHDELVKKGYYVEEIQHISAGKKQYTVMISIPQYGNHNIMDDLGFFFLPFFNNFHQPLALTDYQSSESSPKIEELPDEPIPKQIPVKQRKQSVETRVNKVHQVGEPRQMKHSTHKQ